MSTLTAAPAVATAGSVDPRGLRFAAGLTVAVLAGVLLLGDSTAGLLLLAAQTALFALAAGLGVQRTPYAWAFRRFVRPLIGAPAELEEAGPPRFAQAVGFAFAATALTAFLAGLTTFGLVAAGFALAAALLNAAFGFCLGCEIYLLLRRATTR